jgi:enterochelin esterase-like enzyme
MAIRAPSTLDVEPGRSPAVGWLRVGVAVALFLSIGLLGAFRYVDNFWRYRGFSPPHDPAFVKLRGSTEQISVKSDAIGGRSQAVYVFLPPGYANHPHKRYPVFYLLHGFPGRPQGAFLWTNRVGVVEDVLVHSHRAHPALLVMPYGSTGFFTDKEWANGINPGEGWETFVARDVVKAIDARYRTIANGRGRALGGLSEGGYGALNIGLHHPGEFGVLESWSGYFVAQNVKSVFGGDQKLMRHNSPLLTLPKVANRLRRAHTYVWMYTGANDGKVRTENANFAAELKRGGVRFRFNIFKGGHDWALWRSQTALALAIASKHLAHG